MSKVIGYVQLDAQYVLTEATAMVNKILEDREMRRVSYVKNVQEILNNSFFRRLFRMKKYDETQTLNYIFKNRGFLEPHYDYTYYLPSYESPAQTAAKRLIAVAKVLVECGSPHARMLVSIEMASAFLPEPIL